MSREIKNVTPRKEEGTHRQHTPSEIIAELAQMSSKLAEVIESTMLTAAENLTVSLWRRILIVANIMTTDQGGVMYT